MTSLQTRPAIAKADLPDSSPFKIVNAACPRLDCDGDVYFDPATKAILCPSCAARKAASVRSQAE
jgi:hypothetical protein